VDKILRGARPANLPVEEPNVFEMVINLKAAREQDIKIPQSVLLRADRVIE
jgi:putative ABC transport system substrate-binding protein